VIGTLAPMAQALPLIVLGVFGVALLAFAWTFLWREMDTRSRPVRARLVVIALSLVPPSPCWFAVAFVVDLRRHPMAGDWTWGQRLWPWARPAA
jgi:hypothetical protein